MSGLIESGSKNCLKSGFIAVSPVSAVNRNGAMMPNVSSINSLIISKLKQRALLF